MDCIFVKDYNGVQGVALVLAASSVIIYVAVDFFYYLFDPRVKF
jgi:ABC-type dipeptide/oligopeptide/nickel transport system permease component